MASANGDAVTKTTVFLIALRRDLKEWETSFFTANNRKAGREDIKQVPEIGEKYKKYNDLRYPPSKPAIPKESSPSRKRHRSSNLDLHPLPSKRPKRAHSLHPSTIDPYDPPVSAHTSPITHRTSIGPTPQKDGLALGLFDNLSSHSHGGSSKRNLAPTAMGNVQATPSKRASPHTGEVLVLSSGKRHKRSPLSASKQSHLNSYLTPTVSRILKDSTPGSRSGVSKLRFDGTPAFLRRDSQRAVSGKENEDYEEGISWSPVAVRKIPQAYAGKRLSALVKGLRDMEEERLDEDLAMLREMEDGNSPKTKVQQPKIQVNDSQQPDLPLGPDAATESEEDLGTVENKGRDGKPLRVWKKKGQKRTTRKVTMRPNAAKWKPEPAWKGGIVDDEDSDEEVAVLETQTSAHGVNFDEQNSEGEAEQAYKKTKSAESKQDGKDGFVTKVKKKISATAHANFRALKIKNKQSKAKKGGRFGRR